MWLHGERPHENGRRREATVGLNELPVRCAQSPKERCPMSLRIVIATDGSDEAVQGAARACRFLADDADVRVVTVISGRYDPAADQGGFEGPIMTEAEADAEF